jgi:hypothetical protein
MSVQYIGQTAILTLTDENGKWLEVWACYRTVHGEMQAVMLHGVN